MLHLAAIIKVGIFGAISTLTGVVLRVVAADGTQDVSPYITGGGALTTASVLGYVAVKLVRGELVARDPNKVEIALLRLVDERKADHDVVVALLAASDARLERVLTALSKLPGGLEP